MKNLATQILHIKVTKPLHFLLGLIIPDADGSVQRTGGNEGFADASSQAGDGC